LSAASDLPQLLDRRELDQPAVLERVLEVWPPEVLESLWDARKAIIAGEPLPPDEAELVTRAGRAVAEERRRAARESDHAQPR
jgi:hypothetical protein